jgi:hydroxymethylglutaryl-CoA synthase
LAASLDWIAAAPFDGVPYYDTLRLEIPLPELARMPGIVSYGAYLPPTRLGLSVLAGRPAKEGGPERTVAWNDEDAVTMAVAAGANALRGFERSGVDALFFASTTYPFKEKQGAALIAKALDLRRDARTTDVSGSLRAGTDALQAAFDAVAAGSARPARRRSRRSATAPRRS